MKRNDSPSDAEGKGDAFGASSKRTALAEPNAQPSLELALRALPQLIQRRQEELDRREADLRKAEEAFAKETGKAFGSTKPNDVLRLNIGGTRCDVLRRTLCLVEDSMLASSFSGRWDDMMEKDRDGNFFINQPYELFKHLLDFLRAKETYTPRAPPVTAPRLGSAMNRDFVRMVEYYGCTPGVYPTKIEMHRGVPGSANFTLYPDLGVETTEWATFLLKNDGHSRRIKAYEIELVKVERALIGWADPEYFKSYEGEGSLKGVGEDEYSIALDCCSSALIGLENPVQTKSLSICSGTVIGCDISEKRWLVDGEVIATLESQGNACCSYSGRSRAISTVNAIPAFSGKGKWRIKDVVLDVP